MYCLSNRGMTREIVFPAKMMRKWKDGEETTTYQKKGGLWLAVEDLLKPQ